MRPGAAPLGQEPPFCAAADIVLRMTAGRWSTSEPIFVEDVEGSTRPAAYYLAETRDGLYVPYVMRTPAGEGRFPLEWMVRRLTRDNARAIGLHDRGVLAPGYRADLNVIDYDRLRLRVPEVVYDLPSGGRRLMPRAEGYVATIVAGQPVWRDGTPTGALPGRLVRGPQALPA